VSSSYPHTSTEAIYATFKFLEIHHLVIVLENLLLERKVFFISDCSSITGMAIEAFLSFIYPMNWIHGIINPLSPSMVEYTEAPMTITYGLSNQLATKVKPDVEGLFVFLDYNRV
jgi:nucleoside recognition membrane protein YjiH